MCDGVLTRSVLVNPFKGDVQPAEVDDRRDPQAAGGRDQHGRGGGGGRADATARSTVAVPGVPIIEPAEELCLNITVANIF